MTTTGSSHFEFRDPFYYHQLPNGLELLGQRMPSLGSITFGFQFGAGAMNEDDSQLGLCQLLEDMIFQGTTTRSVRQITDEFEMLGARRISTSSFETTRFGAQIVHTKLGQILELTADILRNPLFPKKEFEQLRPLLIQAIKRRDDEPMRRVGELIMKTFYQQSRLARPILGTIDTVSALTVDDIRNYYQKYYRADRALFAIAGNFDWDAVVTTMERLFGDWPTGGAEPYRDHPQVGGNIAIEQEESEQEHIYFAYPSVTWSDPDYYANLLAVEILGGGMTSRLFMEVREKRGLVYAVSASPQPSRSLGAVLIYAGSSPEKGRETAEVIIDELKRLESEGVSQDELDRAKIQLRSELIMQSESSGSRMGNLLRSWWFEHRIIPTSDVKEAIDAVTTEQIYSLLQRFPPTNPLTMVALGPRSQEEMISGLLPV
jgi:predicted Zn-dependent peptidase